jgi:hypothetical protein
MAVVVLALSGRPRVGVEGTQAIDGHHHGMAKSFT